MNFIANNPVVLKIACGSIVAGLLDRFVMGVEDVMSNATFGMVTGVSLGAGLYVSSMIPMPIIPIGEFGGFYQAKTVTARVSEIVIGTAAAYSLNRFVLKNDYNTSQFSKRIGILVASDFVSEYVSDYIASRSLNYLTE
jgi:hypothetical protein